MEIALNYALKDLARCFAFSLKIIRIAKYKIQAVKSKIIYIQYYK